MKVSASNKQLWLMKGHRYLTPKKNYFFNPFFVVRNNNKYQYNKTKKPMTSGELQKQLNKDPSYQELMRKKEEERQQREKFFKEEEKLLLQDLRKIGIKVNSVWDLVNNRHNTFFKKNAFLADYSIAYPVLVKHLDYNYHPSVTEGIIRSLTEKQAKEVAQPKILDLFYKEEDKNLKWAMANALTTLMTWRERQKYPEIAKVFKGH